MAVRVEPTGTRAVEALRERAEGRGIDDLLREALKMLRG